MGTQITTASETMKANAQDCTDVGGYTAEMSIQQLLFSLHTLLGQALCFFSNQSSNRRGTIVTDHSFTSSKVDEVGHKKQVVAVMLPIV